MRTSLLNIWFTYFYLFYSEPKSVLALLNKEPRAVGDPDKYLLVFNSGDMLVIDYGLIYLYNKDISYSPYDLKTIHALYNDEEAYYSEKIFEYCVSTKNYGKDCFIVEKGNENFESLIKAHTHLFEIRP